MAPKTKRYEKKDPISHCLDRPDMYVGSVRLRNIMEYIAQVSTLPTILTVSNTTI